MRHHYSTNLITDFAFTFIPNEIPLNFVSVLLAFNKTIRHRNDYTLSLVHTNTTKRILPNQSTPKSTNHREIGKIL